jgi:hypothetical protein
MALFTLQSYFFKSITLSGDFIVIGSIFKKDVRKKIELYDSTKEVIFFNFILTINFSDRDRYFFWGENLGKIDNFILENKHFFQTQK